MPVLRFKDLVLHLKRKLLRVSIGTPASVGQLLHPPFLVAIENLVAGLAGDPQPSAKFRHRLAGDPQTAAFRPSPDTPSKASLPPQKGEKCNLGVRYDLFPKSRVGHITLTVTTFAGIANLGLTMD
jgi:hypothetical protein